MATVDEIAEMLDKLTLLEAAQLSKQLQEKWGVSAAATHLRCTPHQSAFVQRSRSSHGCATIAAR